MAKRKIEKIDKKKDEKLYAFLATFLSIIGFIIALVARRDNKYVMFYAKQSLIVFIVSLIAGILASAFSILPIIGWIIHFALNIIVLLIWIMSWLNALSGEQREVPIVGHYGRKIDL